MDQHTTNQENRHNVTGLGLGPIRRKQLDTQDGPYWTRDLTYRQGNSVETTIVLYADTPEALALPEERQRVEADTPAPFADRPRCRATVVQTGREFSCQLPTGHDGQHAPF